MRDWLQVVGLVFIYVGAIINLVAAVGLIRLDDAYARFHTATKALSAGVLFLAVGGALYVGNVSFMFKLSLIAVLFLISNPVGTHAIARAVHRSGLEPDGREKEGLAGD